GGIRRKDGDDEAVEHTGAPELLEPEVLPGQNVRDQAEGVGASQASQRYRVGVRDLAALMPGDNVLEQLQLSLVEPLRLRQCAKGIENSRERIAPCGIVVDPFHNLVASGNGCLDHFRREPRSAEGTVRRDRKSTRLNSSHVAISYAVFCLKKKKKKKKNRQINT